MPPSACACIRNYFGRTRKVEGGTTIDYTYDRTDQLIKQTISGVDTMFSYDAYGSLTQSGNSVGAVTTYSYGTASQLTAINPPGTTTDVALTLDALGRYATRVVNGLTDTYGYVGGSETVGTVVGTTTRLSALGSDGSRLATKDGTTSAYLVSDLHGSVAAAEASGSTAVANAIRYDGYGQTTATYTGSGAVAMDAKYQGRLDLSATADQLYDMSARMYSPGLGTFTSLDSVTGSAQNPLSMNRFLYAEANPTTFIDPTGHRPCDSADCGGPISAAEWQRIRDLQNAQAAEHERQTTTETKDRDSNPIGGGTAPGDAGPDLWDVVGAGGAVIGGAGTALWDFGTTTVGGAIDLSWCLVPGAPIGCSPAKLADAFVDDPGGTTSDLLHNLANGTGQLSNDLNSGDPYRMSHAGTSVLVFFEAFAVAGAKAGALKGAEVESNGATKLDEAGSLPIRPIMGGASRGSSGRIVPTSLREQYAMAEVQGAPQGRVLPTPMTDPRWRGEEGWVKMAQNVAGVEIHYVRNVITGEVDDFKFKDHP